MPPKKKVDSTGSFPFPEMMPSVTQSSVPIATSSVPVPVKSHDNDRMQLAASINNLVLRGEQFTTAVEALKQFTNERLVQLDMQITAKKQEFTDLTSSLDNEYKMRHQQLENDFKNKQIKLKQDFDENGLSAVEKFLLTLNKTSVDRDIYQNLQNEYSQLKTKLAVELNQAVSSEAQRWEADKKFALQSRDLQHKAEIASLTAEVEQQKKEIAMLNAQMANMKAEIAAQRELTKEVAQAGAKAQISQNFSGNK